MGLVSTDLLAVERSNTVYKETFGNRANIDATDLILVEAGSTTGGRVSGQVYQCAWSDWDSGGGGGGGATGTHGWAASNTAYYGLVVSYPAQSSDSTAAFSYLSQAMTVTGGTGTATGNLYIGMRIRGSTAYYHDFCLSHLQVVTSAGNAFRTDSSYTNGYDWNFHNTSSSAGSGAWQRCTSALSSQTYTVDPSTLLYGTISTSANNGNWSRGTSTGSTYTGASDGTYGSGYTGGGGSIITAIRQQASSTYYIYTETSGSGYTIGTSTLWLKSPPMTISNGDMLRMNYLATGGSTSTNGLGLTGTNVLYFRFK